MKSNFQDCLTRLLKDEGGYSNDPSDSGGATNFGITIADYRMYIKKDGTPNDVKNMKVADAAKIYKSKYWDALGCDNLESGVDYTCFDYGVNSGLGRPRKALERFKLLKGTSLIEAINNERMTFLRNLAVARPKDQKFLNGWTNRVNRVSNYSKYLNAHPGSGATGAGTAGAVVAGGTLAMAWHGFMNHWILYTLGIVAIALTVDCLIYAYRNRNV